MMIYPSTSTKTPLCGEIILPSTVARLTLGWNAAVKQYTAEQHTTTASGRGMNKAEAHHLNCTKITHSVIWLPIKASSLLYQQSWILNDQGSLYYYKTTLFGMSSLPLSELTRTIYIFRLKNSCRRACGEISPLLLWSAVGKLCSTLNHYNWRYSQPYVFFPNWTADLSIQVWGRHKFPLTCPYLKEVLFPWKKLSHKDVYGKQGLKLICGPSWGNVND